MTREPALERRAPARAVGVEVGALDEAAALGDQLEQRLRDRARVDRLGALRRRAARAPSTSPGW